MANKLVIVESPSKSKTIEKFLGKDYKVIASMGHIRDLSTKGKHGLGIDVDNSFNADYIIIKGKNKLVKDLKKESSKYKDIYLATDPDREGEAISWHLKEELEIEKPKRVIFNEITKTSIINAFNNVRDLDINLVHSQETRRFLDRIIGFRLSKIVKSKTGGKSAGRVQSVALKLIVDKEREIESFVTEEYWSITAKFKDFDAILEKYGTKKIEIKNELEADEILNKLVKVFNIEKVEKKDVKRQPKMPFITSTLQQEANTKLNFTSKKTMMLAQKLYEGIELEDETVGLITYMRTDSTRMSSEFINSTFSYIEKEYGKQYLGIVRKSKKNDNTQDAHEAIRPTNINRKPEDIKEHLSNDEYKLYKIIYYRALASLMKETKLEQTTIILENNNYMFKATGQVISFDGYLKVYSEYESSTDKILPPLDKYKSNVLVSNSIEKEQHFTKPPARYTEAKLIKEMEELGIGRPSTYEKIISTLNQRHYIEIKEKRFHPTDIGITVTDKLQEIFKDIINVKYTASMELDLDSIAYGNKKHLEVLKEFYTGFEPKVELALTKLEKEQNYTGEDCPECGGPLVIRIGKYGKFTACSNFPTCKYIKKEPKEEIVIGKCPKCDTGNVVEKKTKRGRTFYGCNTYPKCDFASWDKPEL